MRYSYVAGSDAGHVAFDPWAVTGEPFPAPERTSRDPLDDTVPIPSPVTSLAEFARECGWKVRMQHSRGHMPHAGNGRPSVLKDLIGLRFGAHPLTDRQAYAVYSRPASGGTWTWGSIMIWGSGLHPYGGCGLAQFKDYLKMTEATDVYIRAWVWGLAVAAHRAKQIRDERPKAAAKPREGMS